MACSVLLGVLRLRRTRPPTPIRRRQREPPPSGGSSRLEGDPRKLGARGMHVFQPKAVPAAGTVRQDHEPALPPSLRVDRRPVTWRLPEPPLSLSASKMASSTVLLLATLKLSLPRSR
ncbi:uncharacterized protein PSFLO_05988 [Pseudozyma flocculosa]|uniref:Uncharacterized protein n=1 Tax=Pseudozyma flocculosa TaxID=84751 RepID=A0A5C3F8V1_9BASI|nr:uncharacterized protein PSFLO_05988 [Pseudozyma flocculosa]